MRSFKFLKRTFLILASLVGLFLAIFLVANKIPRLKEYDTIFFVDAELLHPDFVLPEKALSGFDRLSLDAGQARFPVDLHELIQGNGTVLAVRVFEPGPYSSSDTSRFQKISIWISQPQIGSIDFSDKSKALAYYSKGNSTWTRSQCGGFLVGAIELSKIDDREIRAHLKATVNCVRSADAKNEEHLSFDENYVFSKVELAQLTPWLGKPDPEFVRETYRR